MKANAEQATMKLNDVVTYIAPADLIPNPYQPKSRAVTTPEAARAGWLSLERSGLIHFPVVRKANGKYEIGDGWQRRNWYLYGYHEMKDDKYARVPCVVRELDDQQMADLIFDANGERQDFNPLEWGEFYKKYLDDFKVTQEDLGKRFGKSQGEIANTIRLLDLPAGVQTKIISHEITESHGRELLRLNRQPEKQAKLLKDIEKNKMSVSDLSRRIESEIYQASKTLNPKASSYNNPPQFDVTVCKDCPNVEKLGKELRCLDAECWNKKQKEAQTAGDAAALEELKKQGIERLYQSNELKYNQYQGLYQNFIDESTACQTCIHRAGMKSSYDNSIRLVCIDVECYKQKQEQGTEAARSARREQAAASEKRIDRAVENCADEKLAMSSVIILLGDAFDESLPGWFGVEYPENAADDYNIYADLQKALDALNPHNMAKKLLAGLLKEANHDTTEAVLEKLENPVSTEIEIEEAEQVAAAKEDKGLELRPEVEKRLKSIRGQKSEPIISDAEFAARANARPWPDKETIRAQAETDLKKEPAEKALEAKFTKSVRCAGCGETQHVEFQFDPAEKTEHHWAGKCSKCQAANSIKNKRWDGMMGLDNSGGEDESLGIRAK